MMYKVYNPSELNFIYADEYGTIFDAPSGDVIEAPYTEAEALKEVRRLRTERLYDCDWTQLPDAPLSEAQKEQWRTYRQALRDMMDGFAWNLTAWPKP